MLYEHSVQTPEVEMAFIDRVYRKLNGVMPARLREDFCGTGYLAASWAARRPGNAALGLDIDEPTLAWGRARHVGELARRKPEAAGRVRLMNCDVRTPPSERFDVIVAFNFSYWIFQQRDVLREYFRACRRTLDQRGLLFLDFMGGSECHLEVTDRTRHGSPTGYRKGGFTYVWEHAKFNPISGEQTCFIHFEFPDKTRLDRAYTYTWRMWSIAELRDLLAEAGFGRVRVFWEGEDERGRGTGVYRETQKGTADRSYVGYIVAEREGGEGPRGEG